MTINLTGISPAYRTPGHYAEILYAQGPASAASGDRQVLFLMPKTSAGTWSANTLYGPILSEDDVRTGGGAGSPIHRGIRAFLKINKDAKVFAVPYAATTGGSPVSATLAVTVAGTATRSGILNLIIAGEPVQIGYASGDTPTVIAANMVLAINGRTHLPVTAGSAAGVITLTAKIAGTSQGDGTYGPIRCYQTVTPSTTVTVTSASNEVGGTVAGVEGTTTEAAALATALATIDNVRRYYLVTSLSVATPLGSLKTHITNKSEPKRGLRSVGISAYTGTLAAAQTIATTLNYERLQIGLGPKFQSTPDEIAGHLAAVRQKREQVDCSYNFNSEKLDGIVGPYNADDWIVSGDNDVEDAIVDGLTPLSTQDDGVRIVQSVSTRSKDSTGALDDPRASRTVKISTTDKWTDDFLVRMGLRFGNKKLKDDERLANGKVNSNQKLIKGVVRPSMVRGTVVELLNEYEDEHLQNVEESKASLSINKSDVAGGRIEIGLQLHVIDWFDQSVTRISEVSPN